MTTLVEPRSGRDVWPLFALALAVLALIGAVVGVGLGLRAVDETDGESVRAAAPATATVHMEDFSLSPKTIDVAVGGSLDLMNMGSSPHNLAVKGEGLESPMVEPGASDTFALGGLVAGSYTVFCSVPGHEQAGMTAKLNVVEGDGGSAQPAVADMSADEMDTMMAKATEEFLAGVETEGLGAQRLAPKLLADGTKQFDLTSKVVKWEVERGRKIDAWTYNGMVPGPTIKVDAGDKVRVVLKNELPESTSIHFHGLITPNSQDGVPDITQKPIKPGQTFTYEFTAQPTPAVGMYHSHHNAVKQVPNGLAGAFLVGDQKVPAGVSVSQEHVFMLNDSGTIGFAINGKSFPATAPYTAKVGEWLEFHYMNEGQMIHPMHLHGIAQMVIAKDGFAVPQPYLVDTLNIAPGERYTVLVHADNPGAWAWHCHILSHAEREDGMFGMVTALVVS